MANGAADFIGPPISDEERERLATQKFGRPFSALSEEEKAALYRDYAGEREVANADYMQGQDLLDADHTQGIQAGDVYVGSGYGNLAADVLSKYAGKKMQDKSKADLAGLSKEYALGSRAGGEVAANRSQGQMRMLQSLLKNRQQQSAPTPAAPAQQAPQMAPPAAQGPAQGPPAVPPPQGRGPAPMPAGAQQAPVTGQPPRQQINQAMSSMMQGRGNTAQMPANPRAAMPPAQAGPPDPKSAAIRRKLDEEEKLRALGIIPWG